MKQQCQWKMSSELGPLYLTSNAQGLTGVFLEKQLLPMLSDLKGSSKESKILARASQQLSEYLKGQRKDFDLPLSTEGTAFQRKVWKALQSIPYGKTVSYRDIALRIKNKNATRAVGNANAKNPLCIIVPCHRVIAADGSLGGYSGGLKIKIRLLEIESR